MSLVNTLQNVASPRPHYHEAHVVSDDDIIIVSTRAPSGTISGGMARAVG